MMFSIRSPRVGRDGVKEHYMATFTWQDGNQGIYYYGQFQHYSIVRMADDKLVFRYDDSTIPLDPTLFPRTIVMTIENGQILENDEGTSFYSAGTVTGIKYRDASNNLLIEASDLDLAVSPITRVSLASSDRVTCSNSSRLAPRSASTSWWSVRARSSARSFRSRTVP